MISNRKPPEQVHLHVNVRCGVQHSEARLIQEALSESLSSIRSAVQLGRPFLLRGNKIAGGQATPDHAAGTPYPRPAATRDACLLVLESVSRMRGLLPVLQTAAGQQLLPKPRLRPG
jgi:hypothetical protein